MTVLIVQLDGKLPNLALMRIAAHYRTIGAEIVFRHYSRAEQCQREFGLQPDYVYGSAIFERTRPVAEALMRAYPNAILGGTGVDVGRTLADIGISTREADYSLYPQWRSSIGFTQRGCRLRCGFCVVPRKEGAVAEDQSIAEIWRGDPWPRELLLLDNDFFGQSDWRNRAREIREGEFKVSFCQGINVRFLTEEAAETIASLDYRALNMRTKRIYTAWDNLKDEHRLIAGLERLFRHGVAPDHVMVYLLIGYWSGERFDSWEHRRATLRALGTRPYPMPYLRTRKAVGFQRWVIGAYDKQISWEEWEAANYRPTRLRRSTEDRMQLDMFR